MSPWNPPAIREAVRRRLEPYGFSRFHFECSQDGRVIAVYCRKGTHEYVGTYHDSMLEFPPCQGGTLDDWIENVARDILLASWGHHVKS
jgi:hypothetical protein